MPDIINEYCNQCRRSTNQELVGIHMQNMQEDIGPDLVYEMLKCCGCNAVTMRVTRESGIDDMPPTIIERYPPAIARRIPYWMEMKDSESPPLELYLLPPDVALLMKEIYIAVQNDLRRLAAMGIRAAIETIMKEKIGEDAKFNVLMDKFQKAGYLSTREYGSLGTIIEAGHAATHRAWEPTDSDIATLLDITEAIIEKVYFHEARAQSLDKRVPRRSPHPREAHSHE